MDILDIMIAKALTPQGSADQSAQIARQAAETARTAAAEAASIIDTLNAADVRNLVLSLTNTSTEDASIYNLVTTYPDESTRTLNNLFKLYNTTGENIDGTMTQQAISAALQNAQINLGSENAGKVVIVNNDGSLIASTKTPEDIEPSDDPVVDPTTTAILGLHIDYVAKTFTRTDDALGKEAGTDFNQYAMYGGRKRCIVDDDGTIVAFAGQPNYIEDGSLGQVMVYQPAFYYQRTIEKATAATVGQAIQQETIRISDQPKTGFKLHPAFYDINKNPLTYILLPAYESTYYDVSTNSYNTTDASGIDLAMDKLSVIANAKPLSGAHKTLTITDFEQLATNRGQGWHITNLAAESVNQLLFLIEYGNFNAQQEIEKGVCNLSNIANENFANQTGSTSYLGNTTGAATASTNITNGNTVTYTEEGQRSVSYRGMENPWGNMWRFVGGVKIQGNGSQEGGIPYICDDFQYDLSAEAANYHSVGFALSSNSSWVSALGYGSSDYDWVLMPAAASGANSVLPIGDYFWSRSNLNGVATVGLGGPASHGLNDGLFYYACDNIGLHSSRLFSARLMYIPNATSNSYQTSYNAWKNIMKG